MPETRAREIVAQEIFFEQISVSTDSIREHLQGADKEKLNDDHMRLLVGVQTTIQQKWKWGTGRDPLSHAYRTRSWAFARAMIEKQELNLDDL